MSEKHFQLFNEKFNVDAYLIAVSDHWRLSLRPNQPTIGSAILSLARPCENFSDITIEESADLKEIISYAEQQIKQAFNYDKINYLMLMMVDAHLHFHVIPRYSKTIEFAEHEWIDEKWPTPPDLAGREITDAEAAKIIERIRG